MKVLFIGVWLSPYGNQILNKLHAQPEIDVYNLIDSAGGKHTAEAVHQSSEGVEFSIVSLKATRHRKSGTDEFDSFENLPELLTEIRPDVIVATEAYIPMFIYQTRLRQVRKEFDIALIMKDIPFRTDAYDVARRHLMQKKVSRFGIPIVDDIYNTFYIRRHALAKLEEKKRILNFVDAHVDYVEAAYDIFGSYGVPREKIFITYNSPDTDLLSKVRKEIELVPPILPPNLHRLIHVGRLVAWKRVDMLIRAFAEVKKEFADAELVIVGYGPDEETLKKLASSLGLQKSVLFVGGIYKPEELGKYLLASTIYVLAGMGGISINDAMIFGKPIICSVCDGTEKHLVFEGENGLYFKDGDQQSLVEKVLYLFRNQDLVSHMGTESARIIKESVNIHTVLDGYRRAFSYVKK
jgi:glycosyltransferase involved in cell wall biosynthesis